MSSKSQNDLSSRRTVLISGGCQAGFFIRSTSKATETKLVITASAWRLCSANRASLPSGIHNLLHSTTRTSIARRGNCLMKRTPSWTVVCSQQGRLPQSMRRNRIFCNCISSSCAIATRQVNQNPMSRCSILTRTWNINPILLEVYIVVSVAHETLNFSVPGASTVAERCLNQKRTSFVACMQQRRHGHGRIKKPTPRSPRTRHDSHCVNPYHNTNLCW